MHTRASPKRLPFHADSFSWSAFERFCGAWLVSGTTLPNLNLDSNPDGPARLRIVDALRVGNPGEKQHGIDILVRMETGTRWVVQCKRIEKFGKTDLTKAIAKAEKEFGHHRAERFLLWVTGDVSADATLIVDEHPNWTLWSAERLTNEFIIHTPPRQCFTILQQCFDHAWAKAFFPIPDDLLITASEFFARWEGPDRSFHHHAELIGREKDLSDLADFAKGGQGTKALILIASGGVGKSRLLKALAVEVEATHPGRSVRFVNPDASPDADMPRADDLTKMTVIHDDAHRADVPGLLLAMLSKDGATGSRVILSTRPGAEDSLRERLMNAGYQAKDIAIKDLRKLSKAAMENLAASLMGDVGEEAPRLLAELSGGCALITVVGAELIRRGELQSLDLHQSEHFAREVFTRFEGQELDRLSGILNRRMLLKLLRSVALLSPWQAKDTQASNQMAGFLGIPRGLLESACDSLRHCGLLVTTHEGLRVTPDLFSDHLVYDSCYDEKGTATNFISEFLETFGNQSTLSILRNLAEAQWRAVQKHGELAGNVVAPLWRQFLKNFEASNFWERSRLLEKWKDFAIYLPKESIELANWAMDLKTAPAMEGYGSLNSHDRVLSWLPHLLKPIAIWNDTFRSQALDLLWRWETDSPQSESVNRNAYEAFSEVASFRHNFPRASMGVLDWIEAKLASEDGAMIADSPCGLLNIALRPFFARLIEFNYWQDRKTCVFARRPVSVPNTKTVRRRAFAMITERIIPRGTVAAVNVLPVLGEAIRSSSVGVDALEPAQARSWLPERKLALKAIEETAKLYRNHWVHFVIRQQLRWHIVYGKDEQWRTLCLRLDASLLNTFETRLTRLTLSDAHDDSLESYQRGGQSDWIMVEQEAWIGLLQETVEEMVLKFTTPSTLGQFIENWSSDATRHGVTVKLGELFSELGRQKPECSLAILDAILCASDSCLAGFAATLLPQGDEALAAEVAVRVKAGLASSHEAVVRSFLNVFQYSPWLQTAENITEVLKLAESASGSAFWYLLRMVDFPRERSWVADLGFILAKRTLDADQTRSLAHAFAKQERHGGGTVSDATIDALLERLAELPSLSFSGQDDHYLHWLAEKHPLKLYQFFLKRIEISETKAGSSSDNYEAMPYFGELALAGLADLPDFEKLARELLEATFSRPSEARPPWRKLFIACVSRTSPLLASLLRERLKRITSHDDLLDLVGLLSFEGSVVVYRHPQLVEDLLKKARVIGPAAFDEIQWKLIHAARPTTRGYTNGELDGQYRYALVEAENAYAMHSEHALLGPFYLKIVEIEKADVECQRRMAEASFADDWA